MPCSRCRQKRPKLKELFDGVKNRRRILSTAVEKPAKKADVVQPPSFLPPVNWKSYQVAAADRFVRRCRYQRGALLVHSMGSGKTLTSIYILRNWKQDRPWLIVLPKGLDSEWRREFYTFVGYREDGTATEREQGRKQEAERLLANVTFISYTSVQRLMWTDGNTLIETFRGKYVVCDEAHRLLALLRSQPQQSEEDENVGSVRPLDRAFAVTARLMLVTGTPVQRSWSDLAILANLVAGRLQFPPHEGAFLQKYAKATSYKQYILSFAGFSSNVVNPLLKAGIQASGVAQSVDGWMKTLVPAVANALQGVLSAAEKVSGAITAVNPAIQTAMVCLSALSYLNTMYNKVSVDGAKVSADIAPYVSFYDFASDRDNLGAVPLLTVEKVLLPLTKFQMMQWIRLAHDVGTGDTAEFRIVSRISASDEVGASLCGVESRQDFVRLGRVISNLSEDNLAYGTRRRKTEVGGLSALSPEMRTYAAYALDDTFLDGRVPEGVFQCPKYLDALTRLIGVRRTEEYLPVVYSCYDRYGFQTFSAFMTSLGVPHFIVHPDDSVEDRIHIMRRATSRFPCWEKALNKPMSADSPLCVLIHPTLTEGLSFTLNPELVVLEQPYGLGVQEQIYARVVRTLSKAIVAEKQLTPDKRFPKTVRQYVCSNANIVLPLNRYFAHYGVNDLRVMLPLDFLQFQDKHLSVLEPPPPAMSRKEPTIRFKASFLTASVGPDGALAESPVQRASLAGDEGANRLRKVIEYRRDYYTPSVLARWHVQSATSTNFFVQFLTEWYKSKVVKDFFTEYLEGYRHSLFQTPDEMAEATNLSQASQFVELSASLAKQDDRRVPCALSGDSTQLKDHAEACRLYNDPIGTRTTDADCDQLPMSAKI